MEVLIYFKQFNEQTDYQNFEDYKTSNDKLYENIPQKEFFYRCKKLSLYTENSL